MPWPKTGVTRYNTQLGLQDKSHGMKGWLFAVLGKLVFSPLLSTVP